MKKGAFTTEQFRLGMGARNKRENYLTQLTSESLGTRIHDKISQMHQSLQELSQKVLPAENGVPQNSINDFKDSLEI